MPSPVWGVKLMSPPNWGRLRGGMDNVESGLYPTLALPNMGRETDFVGLKPNLYTLKSAPTPTLPL